MMIKLLKNFLRKLYYIRSFRSFKKYGSNMIFSRGGTFCHPNEISFGNNIFISENFHISARNLHFGNDIMIGPNLVIECDNHRFDMIGKKMFEVNDNRDGDFVKIEDDIWIGANVTVLADVVVAEGIVVGAGSLINKSLPPYTICVGVPCKPVKSRFTVEQLQEHLAMIDSKYSFEQIVEEWTKYNIKVK